MKQENTKNAPINRFITKKSLTQPFHRVLEWIRAGNPPPKTQVKSLYLMVFLLVFGFSVATVWFMAFFRIRFYEVISSLTSLFIIGFLALCPGLYALWVSICCWRRVPGYDWWIIPHFE